MLVLEDIVTEESINTEGLVFHAPLYSEQLVGTQFRSTDKYGHVCSVTGATWGVTGRTLNGTTDFISIPDADILDLSTAITISQWVYRTTNLAYQGVVFKEGAYHTYIDNTNKWYGEFYDGGNWRSLTSTNVLTASTWYHLVWTWDTSDNKIRLYVNGVLDKTSAALAGTINASAEILYLGNNRATTNPAGSEFFGGILGEVRIINRVLSAGEVMNEFLATKWRYV